MPNFLSRPFFLAADPAMLTALLVELRELPQMFRKEETSPVDIALLAGTYWIPANVKDVGFWGMDREVKVELDHPEDTDWDAHHVHFHLVHFTGTAEGWAQGMREEKLQQAEDALQAGEKGQALPAFQLAAEMGSVEAA